MGLFRRRPKSRLGLVEDMERFGRFEIDVTASTDDGGAVWQATQLPLMSLSQENPEGLVRMLADECIPVGGWAVYGAERTVVNLIGTDPPGPDWPRLLQASMEFLRSHNVPPMRIPNYMWMHFLDTGGTVETWLPMRPPPNRATTTITPLGEAEVRRVAKLGPAPDANVVLVRREGHEFVALSDARWSDEDPTRSQSEIHRATTLYDLYLDVAYRCPVRDWSDPELDPFFPTARATI